VAVGRGWVGLHSAALVLNVLLVGIEPLLGRVNPVALGLKVVDIVVGRVREGILARAAEDGIC